MNHWFNLLWYGFIMVKNNPLILLHFFAFEAEVIVAWATRRVQQSSFSSPHFPPLPPKKITKSRPRFNLTCIKRLILFTCVYRNIFIYKQVVISMHRLWQFPSLYSSKIHVCPQPKSEQKCLEIIYGQYNFVPS